MHGCCTEVLAVPLMPHQPGSKFSNHNKVEFDVMSGFKGHSTRGRGRARGRAGQDSEGDTSQSSQRTSANAIQRGRGSRGRGGASGGRLGSIGTINACAGSSAAGRSQQQSRQCQRGGNYQQPSGSQALDPAVVFGSRSRQGALLISKEQTLCEWLWAALQLLESGEHKTVLEVLGSKGDGVPMQHIRSLCTMCFRPPLTTSHAPVSSHSRGSANEPQSRCFSITAQPHEWASKVQTMCA